MEVAGLPDELLVGDSLQATVRVLDTDGRPVPNVPVAFSSTSREVLAVGSNGSVRALAVGSAQVVAAVAGWANAVASRAVRVRGRVEIDSVRPDTVRFGDTLTIYAVASDLDSTLVFIGDVPAPVVRVVRADPGDRAGRIIARVPVFAPVRSTVSLRVGTATRDAAHPVTVIQKDLYEPNDSLPYDLGPLTAGFTNDQLAMEPAGRNAAGRDSYAFRTSVRQDRTFTFDGGGGAYVALADTLLLDYTYPHDSLVLDTLTGDTLFHQTDTVRVYSLRQFAATSTFYNPTATLVYWNGGCEGSVYLLAPDSMRVAFVGMSPSERQVVDVNWAPGRRLARYSLTIENGVRTALPPDGLEGNDDCHYATQVPFGGPLLSLNLHDVLDVDWLRFSVPTQTMVLIRAEFSGPSLLDFGLFSGYPTYVNAVGQDAGPGIRELVVDLAAGTYLLGLYSYQAVGPMPYTLTVGPAPPGALEAFRAAETARPRVTSSHAPGRR